MSRWWNQVVGERDEEDSELEKYSTECLRQHSQGVSFARSSSGEENGECLVLHFKCRFCFLGSIVTAN
ncbi:hypothetical protein CDL12_06754 [Handroanthus impetiginosus]|uniref:Uncharacterized protein n=1 Tax=Handroanthus impetiginosus TaxID=429701 RepID=A0A2G9HSQ6_9LAMI|nr:hypothetical protein CDL12_06754 [Handroanthus impetiginosus]